MTSHYEALRSQALGDPAANGMGRGLALFLRRGLTAWLALCQELLTRADDEQRRQRQPAWPATQTALPPGAGAELVRALASMALAATREEEA